MAEPEFVTTQRAAALLSYRVQHVRRLLHSGKLRGEKLGRDWVVRRDSVDRYLANVGNLRLPLRDR